jgi:serine/threonine-protein kinase
MPHDIADAHCPMTGKPVARRDRSSDRASAAKKPSSAAPPAPAAASPSSVPPCTSRRSLLKKTIGGKYLVRSVLGEGGMGTVFEAEHIALGRSVAVKVLHPNQARRKDAVKRFDQEARVAGSIGHPNICEVYDLGTLDDGSPYLVMEKLVDDTLKMEGERDADAEATTLFMHRAPKRSR